MHCQRGSLLVELPSPRGTELRRFLRNTKQIYDAFGSLGPTRMTARGGDGRRRRLHPRGRGRRRHRRCRRRPSARRRLAPGQHRGPYHRFTAAPHPDRQTERLGQIGYWRTYWDDEEVFYGHVLGCKGLERPAVVLCVNDSAIRERAREKLYVGMSRATDQLIVVGEPDVVREMGGPEVARRLGLD
jgi:hypothetical protein